MWGSRVDSHSQFFKVTDLEVTQINPKNTIFLNFKLWKKRYFLDTETLKSSWSRNSEACKLSPSSLASEWLQECTAETAGRAALQFVSLIFARGAVSVRAV